jgi:hypothetical protein
MSAKDVDKAVMNMVLYPLRHPIVAVRGTMVWVLFLIAVVFKTIEFLWDILYGMCFCVWWIVARIWPLVILALILYGLYNLIWSII